MSWFNHPGFLRTVLAADAASCVVSGLVMTLGAPALAPMFNLPAGVLLAAGLLLFPIALFIAVVALRPAFWPIGVWLVILGNLGWAAGAVWLIWGPAYHLSQLGVAFALAQALAVLILADLEYMGLKGQRRVTA